MTVRSEKEILTELETVCTSNGYPHVLAYFSRENNFVFLEDHLDPEQLHGGQDRNKVLLRTEMSLLAGLMVKADISLEHPTPPRIQAMIDDTHRLLSELHQSMMAGVFDDLDPEKPEEFDGLKRGAFLKEPIFYAAESAYTFQYRDLSTKRYEKDDDWFYENKGFRLNDAEILNEFIGDLQNTKMSAIEFIYEDRDNWTVLPAFVITIQELVAGTCLDEAIVRNYINAFELPAIPCNEGLGSIGDFNIVCACPFISIGDDQYLLFQSYNLVESLYESPFFWMNDDKTYRNTAAGNRGDFTEDYAAARLKDVFGEEHVFQNVTIIETGGNQAGEIDVLVAYANRALIFQAKSKKLTLAARKGNDNAIQDDFKKAVQDGYDQGFDCAEMLNSGEYKLLDSAGNKLELRNDFREIFVCCLVSDHYPSLSFQTRQFLEFSETDVIRPPYVIDLFFLDILCEFLDTPLYFLSFVNRRITYFDAIMSSNEYAILSYHLVNNLWVDDEYSMIVVDDIVSQDLDAAFMARRDNIPGSLTPDGILTRFAEQTFGHFLEKISNIPDDDILEMGFFFLYFSQETVKQFNEGLDYLKQRTKQDTKNHDLSIGSGDSGITIHCSLLKGHVDEEGLIRHCETRKYLQKANSWFGMAMSALSDDPFEYIFYNNEPWKHSGRMERIAKSREATYKPKSMGTVIRQAGGPKVGRNDPCPCGSGLKHKKCCGK